MLPLLGLVVAGLVSLPARGAAQSPEASPSVSASAVSTAPVSPPAPASPAAPDAPGAAASPSPPATPASPAGPEAASVTPITTPPLGAAAPGAAPSPATTAPAAPSIVVNPRAGLMLMLPPGFREKAQPPWSPVSLYVHDARETVFQSNINVVLQYYDGSLETFVADVLARQKEVRPGPPPPARTADVTVAGVTAATLESSYVEREVGLKSRQILLPRERVIYVITATSMQSRFEAFEPSLAAVLGSLQFIPRAPHPPRLAALFTDPASRFALQPPVGFVPPPAGSEGHGFLIGPWEGGDWVRLLAVVLPLRVPDVPQKFKQFFTDRHWAHQTNVSPELPVSGRFLRLHRKSAVLMQLEDHHFTPPVARLAVYLPISEDHALKVFYQLPLPSLPLYHEALEKSLLSLVPRSIPAPPDPK